STDLVPVACSSPDVGAQPPDPVVEALLGVPVVPGPRHGVTYGTARHVTVAGQCVRLHQQAVADVLVQGVEIIGLTHGAHHGTRPVLSLHFDRATRPQQT